MMQKVLIISTPTEWQGISYARLMYVYQRFVSISCNLVTAAYGVGIVFDAINFNF